MPTRRTTSSDVAAARVAARPARRATAASAAVTAASGPAAWRGPIPTDAGSRRRTGSLLRPATNPATTTTTYPPQPGSGLTALERVSRARLEVHLRAATAARHRRRSTATWPPSARCSPGPSSPATWQPPPLRGCGAARNAGAGPRNSRPTPSPTRSCRPCGATPATGFGTAPSGPRHRYLRDDGALGASRAALVSYRCPILVHDDGSPGRTPR